MKSSDYILNERREYSLYTLQQRAIPYVADGLKAASRRLIWTARDGKRYKSATLAGATMPLHPHAAAESAVDTLAAFYGNNIPLLKGEGAFGTILDPTAYSASRYTEVSLSEFTKDVVLRDIEILPMHENYDGTKMEPTHFLPLVPIVLLNPQEGIAVGFACNILPRALDDIINAQINYLQGKKFKEAKIKFVPTNSVAVENITQSNGNTKHVFHGEFEKISSTSVKITNLPYGVVHEKFISKLEELKEQGKIQNINDESRNYYDIVVTFKKGELKKLSDEDVLQILHLKNSLTENLNVIDFDGNKVWGTTFKEIIEKFTDWRLTWYKTRYERLDSLIQIDIEKYKDILTAIKNNVGGLAKKIQSRSTLKTELDGMGIIHVDYVADLPVYRFTEEEKIKVERLLDEARTTQKQYRDLIKSHQKRQEKYIEELSEILTKYKQKHYHINMGKN